MGASRDGHFESDFRLGNSLFINGVTFINKTYSVDGDDNYFLLFDGRSAGIVLVSLVSSKSDHFLLHRITQCLWIQSGHLRSGLGETILFLLFVNSA